MTRRRRIVRIAREFEPTERGGSDAPSLTDILGAAAEALDAFMLAMGKVADPDAREDDAGRALGASLAQITHLKTALGNCPRRRPLVAIWEGAAVALEGIDEASALWVQVLVAAEPIEAQRLAEQAQKKLDEAPSRLQAAHQELADVERAFGEGSSPQFFGVLARRAAARANKEGSADAAAASLYHRVTGQKAVPEHRGRVFLIEDERARLVFDRERYWSLVTDLYKELHGNEHFSRMAADPSWRRAYASAAEQFADAAVFVEAVAQHAYHQRQLVRADMDLVKTLLEGPGKMVLRTRLAVKERRAYSQVRGDVRSLADRAEDQGWGETLLGLNKQLRDAISHEEFEFDDGTLVLDRGQPTEAAMGAEILTNEVLSGIESTLAMHTGLTLALMEVDEALAEEASRAAVSPEQACWLGLEMGKQPVEAVMVKGNTAEVRCSGQFGPHTFGTLAGTTYLLPQGIEHMRIESIDDGVLEGPLWPYREHASSSDEWERELCIWKVLTQWQHEGKPVAHRRLWRCWVTSAAVRDRENDPRTAISRLKDLRTFAEHLQDAELRDFTVGMMRFHRHRLMGMRLPPEEVDEMLARAREWGPRPRNWPRLIPQR